MNIHSVNPLYLIIGEADGSIKETNRNKYSTFTDTDKKKEVLEKYTNLLDLFLKKMANILHKFFEMNLCMNYKCWNMIE